MKTERLVLISISKVSQVNIAFQFQDAMTDRDFLLGEGMYFEDYFIVTKYFSCYAPSRKDH